jgi:hypothetical protein
MTAGKHSLVALISILAIIGSVTTIYLNRRGTRLETDLKPAEAVDEVVAEETIKLMAGRDMLW